MALINRNDLDQGIQWAYDDSRRYYLVGYVPNTPRKTGMFHKIQVDVTRKDVKVRSRNGYFETGPVAAFQKDISAALTFPGLFHGFSFEVETLSESRKLQVRVRIPMKNLAFVSGNDQFSSFLDVFGAMIDKSGKFVDEKLAFLDQMKIGVERWNPEALRQAKDIESEMETSPLAPGDYQLVVGVRQMPSGRIATKTVEISIN
jgi:hypothetical protein